MAAELTEIVQAYPERQRRRSLGSRVRRVLRGLRWRLALGLIRSAFRIAKAGGRTYQPVEIGGKRFANVRDTDERWQAVSQVLRDYRRAQRARHRLRRRLVRAPRRRRQ